MNRIGYAPGAFDRFHIGHLSLLRRSREHCDFLMAGVMADDVLIQHKGVMPAIPLGERLEIVRSVRFVDVAIAAMTHDKVEIWKEFQFNVSEIRPATLARRGRCGIESRWLCRSASTTQQ
jgi:glycerol-3-phosphate cytidylyltransferase